MQKRPKHARSHAKLQVLRKARGRTVSALEQTQRPRAIQPVCDPGLTDDQVEPRMRLFQARVRPMVMTVPSPQ